MAYYGKLTHFPLGSIKAEGFLRMQMERGRDGMCGHLHELEPEMIADPYVRKSKVKAWSEDNHAGWGAEISGNYWTGYIQYAFTLGDEEMIATATEWVNAMMARQRADGYLGTYDEADEKKALEDYNGWGTSCAMRGLLAFYEATKQKDVLSAVHRCMLWFCDAWSGDKKTCYMGQYLIEPMVFTYLHTGDSRLLDFACDYIEFLCKRDLFRISYKSMLNDDHHYHSNHTAGLGVSLRLPALVYAVTGRKELLDASVRGIKRVLDKSCHLSGGPVSATEYLGPVGATTETEYCSFAFYNATYARMGALTGESFYGDLMEQMFYNGAQGARKKDERAIAYLSAPNQIYATTYSSSFGAAGDMQAYAPCYPVSCCPVNAVAVVPEFIRHMLMKDERENVYVMAYGPCRIQSGGVALSLDTHYPFRNRVCITLACDRRFTLFLKIPTWSKGYRITVNGVPCPAERNENGFAPIEREWHKGDTVELCFDAEVEILHVDDTDCANKHPLAIKYGALLFAYHIPETWEAIPGCPMTPLPEGYSWWNVNPYYKPIKCDDPFEVAGTRRECITWNIALDERLTKQDVEVEEIGIADGAYAWEAPMIKLHTHCYKAPDLCASYPHRTFEPFGEYQCVTRRLPLTLVPYGCTNLRITYFPKADPSSVDNLHTEGY